MIAKSPKQLVSKTNKYYTIKPKYWMQLQTHKKCKYYYVEHNHQSQSTLSVKTVQDAWIQ